MPINLALQHGDHVLPCPFCGCATVELINTHTACYWIECGGCGAEVHGKAFEVKRRTTRKGRGGSASARESIAELAAHRRAADSALKAWNRRDYNPADGF